MKKEKIMCYARTRLDEHSGGSNHPCPFRAKYKIVHKGIHDKDYEMKGYTIYLCGLHIKGRGYNPNETITVIKTGEIHYV